MALADGNGHRVRLLNNASGDAWPSSVPRRPPRLAVVVSGLVGSEPDEVQRVNAIVGLSPAKSWLRHLGSKAHYFLCAEQLVPRSAVPWTAQWAFPALTQWAAMLG